MIATDENNIIPFPDFKKLKTEIEKMRIELSMLLLERDELQLVVCKNFEMKYLLLFGSLEYQLFETQCAVLRLKRKVELIQIHLNRQESIDLSVIDEQLIREFADYQRRLNEQLGKMNEALRRNQAEILSKEESMELKRLYRLVVKHLHPDLHPENTSEQIQLFITAVESYHNGDLTTLKIIAEMFDGSLETLDYSSIKQLAAEKSRLEKALVKVNESITKIKSEFPYTEKELLQDQEKIIQRKENLTQVLNQYKELIVIYQSKITEILGGTR